LDSEILVNILWLAFAATALTLLIFYLKKNEKINNLQSAVNNLKTTLEEMDEQAKLIVRTDIALNKTQEELDKKLTGLYALQRLSRAISTTLEEKHIFRKIELSHLEDLGFEKACAFLWNAESGEFVPYLYIGYMEDEIDCIIADIAEKRDFYLDLIGRQKTLSSISLQKELGSLEISKSFHANSFVISPIMPKEGDKGFIFVGAGADMPLTEGDEEFIILLANQVSQALDNARLFEHTWMAQQNLERKVEERTQELSQALEEVKIISKRKTDFISAVSHELRTPLTSVKGYAAILIEEKLGALPPAVKERLEKINRHSDELVRMVNDLLDISRIEAGKTIMRLVPQDIRELSASVADLISIQCKEKDIELLTEIPEALPKVLADRSQIERVFINLLGNAVKFTPRQGKIIIRISEEHGRVKVDIQDSGIGMPPEALERIFDEFYRVDNEINQHVKGTGLGLSLVKHIVEAHQGRIWVTSTQGKGSTFSFTLPKIN